VSGREADKTYRIFALGVSLLAVLPDVVNTGDEADRCAD
jgi:hypothetical protein